MVPLNQLPFVVGYIFEIVHGADKAAEHLELQNHGSKILSKASDILNRLDDGFVVESRKFFAVLRDIGHRMSELVAKLSREVQQSLSKISSGATHPIICPHVEIDENSNVHVQMDELVL
ncbi:hypothetical protein MBLNU13_g04624t1 [Cladosporium sp. NU13]